MFKMIAIAAAVAIAGVLLYAATRPNDFHVERSASIKSSPDRIFALIDNLHDWSAWSPYEKLDPAMKRSFSGPDSGKGAGYAWDGNGKAGAGSMEITESLPSSKIVIKLDFVRPFEGHNIATFTLQPEGDSTRVTWSMDGPSPYLAKLMGTFFNMDHMIGRDFEAGLDTLKTQTEQPLASPAPDVQG